MLKKQNTKVTSGIHCAGNTSQLSSKDALTLIPKTWHFFFYDEKKWFEIVNKTLPANDLTMLDLVSGKPKEKDKETQGIPSARVYQSQDGIFLKTASKV